MSLRREFDSPQAQVFCLDLQSQPLVESAETCVLSGFASGAAAIERDGMTQHYTRNTVEASAYCLKCKKQTMHRVDADKQQGRLGPCLECIAKLNQAHDAPALSPQKALETQQELF